MNGFILQSLPRSGTNYVLSLTDATGLMGTGEEWLHRNRYPPRKDWSAQHHYDWFLRNAVDDNNRFAFKVFPDQLKRTCDAYDYDIVYRLVRQMPDTVVIRIRRRDKIAQAISMLRAEQSGDWIGREHARQENIRYDYDAILDRLLKVYAGEAFWDAYNELRNWDARVFAYEDLVDDPEPLVSHLARRLRVDPPSVASPTTARTTIQRDERTERWRERFLVQTRSARDLSGVETLLQRRRIAPRTIGNLIRFLGGRPLEQ